MKRFKAGGVIPHLSRDAAHVPQEGQQPSEAEDHPGTPLVTADGRISAMSAEDAAAAQEAPTVVARSAWDAAIPARFRAARLADLDGRPEIGKELRAWSADEERPNLVLIGAVGVGKSHAATAAVRGIVGRGASIEWTPIGEMIDRLDWRRPDSPAYLQRLIDVDVLVLDDIGTERSNEWTGERVYTVVNRRWLERRPVIATTNLDPPELAEAIGERTYSRLTGGALLLALAGDDLRKKKP